MTIFKGLSLQIRVPPHNLDAEISILGALMLEPTKFDEISDVLNEDYFYKTAHRTIYNAFRELYVKQQPIDILTVSEHLKRKDVLEAIGGSVYLAEILNQTPTTANLKTYVEIVVEKAILRKLIFECSGIVNKAYDEEYEEIGNFLDQAESKIFGIAEQKKVDGLQPANEIIKRSLTRIQDLYEKGGVGITGVATGYTDLDKMTAGFQPGDLIIVAARPSMGKTAFTLNIATHAALRDNKKVAFFSLEMSEEQLMMRVLASEAKIDMSLMRIGKIPDSKWPQLISAAGTLSKATLFIDGTSGISPFEIRAKCRRMKAMHGIDMIIIDYLQLMDLKQKVESRERAVSEISKTLKSIARELKVPVVALSQLNRSVEGRADRRPMLSDLRESGSIEQDADVIMMLYREDYYEKDNPDVKGIAEVIVGKQRNGPTDTVKLAWLAQYGQFANLAPDSLVRFNPQQKDPSDNKGAPGGGRIPNRAPKY